MRSLIALATFRDYSAELTQGVILLEFIAELKLSIGRSPGRRRPSAGLSARALGIGRWPEHRRPSRFVQIRAINEAKVVRPAWTAEE
jgi:hypothetical protein